MKKYLIFAIIVLIVLSSCTRIITNTIVKYELDSVFIRTTDTIYTVKPEPIEIIKSDTVIIESTPDCPKHPVIYTDTTWVEGTYSDAYALIWANRLIVGIKEGKEFDLLLKNAITERNYYKEKYESEKKTVVKEKLPWRLYLIIVLLVAIIFRLLGAKFRLP